MVRIVILGCLALVCFNLAVCSTAGSFHNYRMKSKVALGLTEHGAGLEYGEWLVNFLIAVGMAILSALGCAFCTYATLRATRRRRRLLREGLIEQGMAVCIECGYDLRGQVESRCPECGKPFDPALLTPSRTSRDEPPA